jgi:hypothetical protein
MHEKKEPRPPPPFHPNHHSQSQPKWVVGLMGRSVTAEAVQATQERKHKLMGNRAPASPSRDSHGQFIHNAKI